MKTSTLLLASLGLGVAAFLGWAIYRDATAPRFSYATPDKSTGYSTGFSLGNGMGLKGADFPTDDALRSMSAIHAPNDQLQFRVGYRDGLVAGAKERVNKR